MAKIDKKKFKANIIAMTSMFIAFCVLIAISMFIENDGFNLGKLGNGNIDITKLVINEIMTSNDGAYIDSEGNSFDWIELYNGTENDINLYNYALTNRENGEIRWTFPNVTIPSKGYLIVYLPNTTKQGMYANFNLNRVGGELLTLKSNGGKVVDAVRTTPLEQNQVMARDGNGNWISTDEFTPGFANNAEGLNAYYASLYAEEPDQLIINEILPNNRGNHIIEGGFYGYVEVQNTGKNNVNLSDYFLSDRITAPFLWRLPDEVLKPGEIYVVYTSGLDNDNHASFSLDNQNGVAILSKGNKIVDEIEYSNLANGYALIKLTSGFSESTSISPGYENNNEGITKFINEQKKNPKDLIIAEVMNSNTKFMAHNGNQHYSWISLYNNSGKTINLSDYTLTTNEASKNMYQLENKELKAGEFYIVMASGDTNLGNAAYKHTNFNLSKTQSLYLYNKGNIVDAMFISDIPIGYSYGRNNKDGFYYFGTPTPGKLNSGGRVGISSTPIANVDPGVYNDIKNLSVELKGTGPIYYTLDGSEPNRNSRVYNGPLVLSKTTVIRAIQYEDGRQPSVIFTGTYIINEKHTLPVISVSLPSSSLNKLQASGGDNTLYKAHAELYEDGSSFTIDCGIRLFGGSTRWLSKKSFTLKFSKRFGDGKLDYKVFDNREAVEYDTIVLRSGSQDHNRSMIRDELATSIMDDYGTVNVLAYKAVILYINGNYWGIYFIREFADDEYVSNNFNVSREEANIVRVDNNVNAGSGADYKHLLNYIKNNDMSQTKHYEYVKTKLDIDNYIDFWSGQQFVSNNDIINMRFMNHKDVDDGRIKMIFYDFDWAMYNTNSNHMTFMLDPGGSGTWNIDTSIMRGLMKNKEFKARFLERFAWNMNNVWTTENVLKRYNELIALIEPEMPRNQARWNNTMANWRTETAKLKTYITKRRAVAIAHVKAYYGLSDAKARELFD